MPTIRETLHHVLQATHTDEELAEALLRSGAVPEVLRLAAATDEDLQAQLGYTKSSLRAQLSKARRRLPSAFPLPVVEGRWWLARDIAEYRAEHSRRPNPTPIARTTRLTGETRSDANTSITRTDILDSSTGSTGG